jgi:hypothetical protein
VKLFFEWTRIAVWASPSYCRFFKKECFSFCANEQN